MKGTLLIFRPDDTPLVTEVDGPPTLDLLKDGIGGGYLEVIPYFNTIRFNGRYQQCFAFCDEDGIRKDLPINPEATMHWDNAVARSKSPLKCAPSLLRGQILVVMGDGEF